VDICYFSGTSAFFGAILSKCTGGNMRKQSLAAFLIAVLLGIYVVQLTSVNATEDPLESIHGVVRVQVVEATEEAPSYYKFFVEQCNGDLCDFTAMKENVNIQFVYLSGKFDFLQMANKEVYLVGQSYNKLNLFDENRKIDFSFNQNFEVSKVEKVIEPPPVNELVATPISVPPPTLGSRNVLAMLINFQQAPTTPYNQQQIKNWVFTGPNSARRYFEDSSFNQFTIKGQIDPTGDVTPWLSLTANQSADCGENLFNAWRIEADNLAEAQGYSKTAYKIRLMLHAPIPNCSWSALATVGTFGDTSGVTYVFLQIPANGSEAGLRIVFTALVHEMEHCLGQGAHANGQETESGPVMEYEDRSDPMGNAITFNNNIHRIKFGWHTTAQLYPAIETRKAVPERFRLQTPAVATKGIGPSSPPIGAFIVLRDMSGNPTGEVFMLERRRSVGQWDQFGTDVQAYVKGLIIRKVRMDFQNLNTGSIIQNPSGTLCCKSAALVPDASGSATWTSIYGVTIKAYTPTVTGMWVEVTLGPNYPAAASLQSEGKTLK
jgi:hypothetical protein